MTERFLEAIDYVFEHEGGFNNVKGDKGGATNWGVSLRFLKSIGVDINGDGHVDWLDIKLMTKEQAEMIYWNEFWKPFYDSIPKRLAIKIFDTAVNACHPRAHKLLQMSLNDISGVTPLLVVDGVIGKKSFDLIPTIKEENILAMYCIEQKKFYEGLAQADPEQSKFLAGWRNRAKWLPA